MGRYWLLIINHQLIIINYWLNNYIMGILFITHYEFLIKYINGDWCTSKQMRFLWKWLIYYRFYEIIWKKLRFKQFVVTNCSKERPGSIVTKTLKNWILISIATSKESHFNPDFKYISFIKFSLTHQKLRAWENLPYLRK